MKRTRGAFAAAIATIVAISGSALAQQSSTMEPKMEPKKVDPLRPRDPAANLPSDSGSQTTLPSGAVTGAGHAYGRVLQPDVGEPGGLEQRAREEAREAMGATGASTPLGSGGRVVDLPSSEMRKQERTNAAPR